MPAKRAGLAAVPAGTVPAVPQAEVDELLRETARLIEGRLDDIGREIARAISEEIDDFTSEAVTWQTVAATRGITAGFARALRKGTDPAELGAPPEAMEYARTYVHRGISLNILLRSYRLGGAHLSRIWTETMTETAGRPEVLVAAGQASSASMFAYVDRVTEDVVRAFEEERESWARDPASVRAETVAALLADEVPELEVAERRLSYRLARRHLALIIWAPDGDGTDNRALLERAATEIASEHGIERPLTLIHARNVGWQWLGGDEQKLQATADAIAAGPGRADGINVALGEVGSGAEGFRASHEQATQARRIGRLAGRPAGTVIRFGDALVPILATADPAQAAYFVRRELGDLAGADEASVRLRQTLAVYFEEGESALRTSERLGIHPNTVTYRLRRCGDILGRSPQERRLEIQLALRLVGELGPDAFQSAP